MNAILVTRDAEVIYLARKFRFVREVPENRGQRVEAIQRWSGGKPGDSWCAHFATMVLDLAFEGASPIPRTGSCDAILGQARANGWLRDTPAPGDLYLVLRSPTDAHHVGIVIGPTGKNTFLEVSGNTNTDGSDNGIGVFERSREIAPGRIVFVRYPR